MNSAPLVPLAQSLHDSARAAAESQRRASRLLRGGPLLLFGSGGLGRILLRGLRQHGVRVEAFVDNNRSRWNQSIEDVPIVSPEVALERFGTEAVYVVSVWNASPRRNHAEIAAQLHGLGCGNTISFADIFRALPDTFLPYYAVDRPEGVGRNAAAIEEVEAMLADPISREVFRRQVSWRVTADFDSLPAPAGGEQYFADGIYALRPDEGFVDCGAFDGDTLQQFIRVSGGKFSHYWALEPDLRNLATLQRFISSLAPELGSRITCLPLAASDRRGLETFDASGSAASAFSAAGSLTVECAPLDEVVPSCTLIKIDVEGAEPKVIEGARGLISRDEPVLAIAAYHTQGHLWELPLQVRAINPAYRFFYREHNAEGFDVVLYAVPPSRAIY